MSLRLRSFVGLYALTFAIGRGLFRRSTDASAVQALTVGYPDMAFIGLPILVATVGQTAGTLPVFVGNIVTSLVLVPVTVAVLASKTASTTDSRISLSRIVWSAIKPPLVWLPSSASSSPSPASFNSQAWSTRRCRRSRKRPAVSRWSRSVWS